MAKAGTVVLPSPSGFPIAACNPDGEGRCRRQRDEAIPPLFYIRSVNHNG